MRIETELRNAIKSAEKHQPSRMDWQQKKQLVNRAIEELAATRRGKRIKIIASLINGHSEALDKLRKELCKNYGIQVRSDGFEMANCGGADAIRRFKKAGGKYPVEEKPNWTTDQVIAELVAAEPKDADKILRKYGINWH